MDAGEVLIINDVAWPLNPGRDISFVEDKFGWTHASRTFSGAWNLMIGIGVVFLSVNSAVDLYAQQE